MKYSDLVSIAAASALAVAMGAAPAVAKSGATKVKPAASAKAKPVKAPTSAAAKTNANAVKPKAAKPKAANTKPLSSPNTAAAPSKPTPTAKRATGEKRMQNQDSRPVPTTTILPKGKAVDKLAKNANLREKMQSRLPRGMDVMAAAGGFKNLGQFVAAVNVSNNLGIEFTVLKRLMVGQGYSLGQAIQQAKAMDAGQANTLANAAVIQANTEVKKTRPGTAPRIEANVTANTPNTSTRPGIVPRSKADQN